MDLNPKLKNQSTILLPLFLPVEEAVVLGFLYSDAKNKPKSVVPFTGLEVSSSTQQNQQFKGIL